MYPTKQYQVSQQSTVPAGGIFAMGVAGAVITATAAAAKNARDVKDGVKTKPEAVSAVAKEALGGGLAMAAGAIVAKTLFRSGTGSLLTMLAVGAGVKYLYDGVLITRCCTMAPEAAPAKHVKKA